MSEAVATLQATTARAVPVAAAAVLPLIRMQGVTKIYDAGELAVHALRGIDLEVERGEFVALIGPSGSGKSTLMAHPRLPRRADRRARYPLDGQDVVGALRVAARRDPQREGRLRLPDLQPAAEGLGPPQRRAADALRRRRRAPSGGSAPSRSLEKVGPPRRRRSTCPSELSGGQRQRVAIARALANRPALLLADEPTGALDSKTGHEVLELFDRSCTRRGNTIVLVTHDPRIAERCERVVSIVDGRIEDDRRN